ncbi:cytochrome c3 family protein [Shewanella sp. Isolate11]|uniref:cytochrome c3 family protein n=1 Tax=Shewanella sp. Isolate11 TaxID=2908530 RepID=UPI001EFE7A42|nr:cytochrome c3 family protein [Shewanella sp. Isolate11]MCG9695666.1 nitrite reductase [Shewanella sp. Isolate11]
MRQVNPYQSISIITLLLGGLTCALFMLPAQAENTDSSKESSQICIKCHKRNGQLLGIHSSEGLAILCQDCHGEKATHPKKGSNINRFANDSSLTNAQQTEICLHCHSSQQLGEQEWTHNVHSNKVSCAQCHRLHTETDPMLSLSNTQRSQLCVSCHQKSH